MRFFDVCVPGPIGMPTGRWSPMTSSRCPKSCAGSVGGCSLPGCGRSAFRRCAETGQAERSTARRCGDISQELMSKSCQCVIGSSTGQVSSAARSVRSDVDQIEDDSIMPVALTIDSSHPGRYVSEPLAARHSTSTPTGRCRTLRGSRAAARLRLTWIGVVASRPSTYGACWSLPHDRQARRRGLPQGRRPRTTRPVPTRPRAKRSATTGYMRDVYDGIGRMFIAPSLDIHHTVVGDL